MTHPPAGLFVRCLTIATCDAWPQRSSCATGVPADQCSGAVWTVPAFNLCAIAWRLSTLMVVKHGSATLAFMANAVLLPICDMFFDEPSIGAVPMIVPWARWGGGDGVSSCRWPWC